MSEVPKITPIVITVLLLQMLLPLDIFAAVKFRYITAIYSDDKEVALKYPEGVACNQESLLILADSGNGRFLRYSFENRNLTALGGEIKTDQVPYPAKTEINSKGEIYVLDRKKRSIIRLSPEGEFKNQLDPIGLPSPTSYVPRSFTLDTDDNIYILDIRFERVLVLTSEGRYLHQIKFPEEYGFFSDVAVNYKGTVLLLDSVKGIVFSAHTNSASFSPLTKSLKEYVRFPASMTTDSRGRIYLADRNGGSIIILGQEGTFLGRQSGMGWKEGSLNHPSQMCINGKGEVFVADTSNNRVQIFKSVE
jgi:DNA-binding beta-propeller fold protein YncE